MRARMFALGLALTVALAGITPAAAQDATARTSDWRAVQALTAGERVVVKTTDDGRKTGRFDSANDLQLVITRDGRRVTYARDRVRLVQINRGTSRGKGALLGAAIGGGGGLAIGAGVYDSADGEFIGSIVPVIALVGAGIGAGIGALFGKGSKNVTIYEAP
ncbi:MAG TPA: hypothetical protein VF240_20580 [Pyrinomonadaceae bacterium]